MIKTYVLIKDNLVSYALKIDSEDEDFISKTLNSFLYDSLEILDDDHAIYSGQEKYENGFRNIKPFESWSWNENLKEWSAPVEMPNSGKYIWNEENLVWDACQEC